MKTKTSLFLVAIAAAGLFAFPSVLATFAGSHTMEAPTDGGRSLDCTKCHQYIVTELNATTKAADTFLIHKTGANEIGYMNYMFYGEPSSFNKSNITITDSAFVEYTGPIYIKKGNSTTPGSYLGTLYVQNGTNLYSVVANYVIEEKTLSLKKGGDYKVYPVRYVSALGTFTNVTVKDYRGVDTNKDGSVDEKEVCKLCHWRGYFGVDGTHTGMTVVGCTNANCHGNAQTPGKAVEYFADEGFDTNKHLGAGYQLARNQEAHSNFYYAMNSTPSTYVTADGKTAVRQNLTADYYTCLACHTHVGMKLSIKRPAAYDVGMNKSNATMDDYKYNTGSWLESLEINNTATNMGDNGVAGNNVTGVGLNTSDITIIKDPTSAWMNEIAGKENKWSP